MCFLTGPLNLFKKLPPHLITVFLTEILCNPKKPCASEDSVQKFSLLKLLDFSFISLEVASSVQTVLLAGQL